MKQNDSLKNIRKKLEELPKNRYINYLKKETYNYKNPIKKIVSL